MDTLLQDLRLGWRGLRARPGFSAAAILTLALGIGANTAVFSVIQHVLLAPLPYHAPDRAVVIWSKWRGFDKTWVSDLEAQDYATRVPSFTDAGAWSVTQVNVTDDVADPARIGAAVVTPNVFDILGVRPVAGRTFTPAESEAQTPTVVVLSYGLWQQRFAGADVIGRTLLVNGVAREIIGIMPRSFQLPTDYVVDAQEPTSLWLPYRLNTQNRGSHSLYAIARLRDGATVAQANAELKALADENTRDGLYPVPMAFSPFAVTTVDEAVGAVRPALALVFGAVACLLLIACANVANLLLVRADTRGREMAVRAALGARPGRLARQIVTEVSVLAAGGAVIGIVLAWLALQFLLAEGGTSLPRSASVTLDGRVLAFSVGLAALTLLLVALVPALRSSRVPLVDAFKDGSQQMSANSRHQRLRGALVVVETALAVALVAGAGLLLRSLWQLQRVDLGFDPDRVLTMRLALPATTYDTPEKVNVFYEQLLGRVRALPGVERAGLLRLLPLAAPIGDWGLTIEGYMPPPGTGTPGDWQVATAGGPEALGERLLSGRWLSDADRADAPDVALVNRTMADRYWPGQDPLGRRFRQGGPDRPWIMVVGVVADVRHNGVTTEIKPKFYRAHAQFHRSTGNPARNMTLVIKTAGEPAALAAPVRREIRMLDAALPVAAVRSMAHVVETAMATARLTGTTLATFAALALALAAIGIHGVLAYVVSHRRQEIGIRMAMGASPTRIVLLVVRGALTLATVGVAIGLGLAALGTQLARSLLVGVTPLDLVSFTVAPALLLAVAVSAAVIPAWRATRVDPSRAIR